MTASPRRRAPVTAVVAVLSVLLIVTGVVLLARGPAAERVPATARLAAAQPVPTTAGSPSTPARPSSSADAASKQSRTTGWPVRSAALRPPADDAGGRPTRLEVPALDLSLPIRPTGVDDHQAMALPEKPGELGWYRFGARPGDRRGSTVLGGHVDSRTYGAGPLAGLWRLDEGDRLTVITTSGRQNYTVSAVQRIAKADLDTGAVFDRDGSPVLRLLTCGGAYLPREGGYVDNVVVTARPT